MQLIDQLITFILLMLGFYLLIGGIIASNCWSRFGDKFLEKVFKFTVSAIFWLPLMWIGKYLEKQNYAKD